jgi:hypothetical protein
MLLNPFLHKVRMVDTCSICLETHDTFTTALPCGHMFHSKCIIQWMVVSRHTQCPLCREVVCDIEAAQQSQQTISPMEQEIQALERINSEHNGRIKRTQMLCIGIGVIIVCDTLWKFYTH